MTTARRNPGERVGKASLETVPSVFDPKSLPPDSKVVRAFGVDYVQLTMPDGGHLYLTKYGLPHIRLLMPDAWYDGDWLGKKGERMKCGSGAVYRLTTREMDAKTGRLTDEATGKGRTMGLLVKWSRMSQQPSVTIQPEVQAKFRTILGQEIDPSNTRFNSPFEEFGLVMELREGSAFGESGKRVLTQKPLAIYSPAESVDPMRRGREEWVFSIDQSVMRRHDEDETRRVELDIRRGYAVIYEWVKGVDAAQSGMTADGMDAFTTRVIQDLERKGFVVPDTKPAHFIVRPRKAGGGEIGALVGDDKRGTPYALVDFELLRRTPAHELAFRARQRTSYVGMQKHRFEADETFPPNLRPTEVMGVKYVHGKVESTGGELWVVGSNPRMFDFFRPERWLHQPTWPLSPPHEIFETVSKDQVHLIWADAEAGRKPDPSFYTNGREIERHGFNSPFEQFQMSEELRRRGISTVYPRAVYLMGNDAGQVPESSDLSRYESHKGILTPDGLPVLRPDRKYLMLWAYWEGADVTPPGESQPAGRAVKVIDALFEGLITHRQAIGIINGAQSRMAPAGLREKTVNEHSLVLFSDGMGGLMKDARGSLDMVLSVDTRYALKHHLIDRGRHYALLDSEARRVRQAGFEDLNLVDSHLLLSMTPEGELKKDADHRPVITHCNFEFFKRVQ
ncbi:MAG: hypothetical protein PHG85_06115 [Candidatus Altiarchaeota archaeon]|nr:hypothetical protein [Candidatus Altiarchaeota archaeon]